ncbi:Alkaline phosphatase synthesis sensor protein PhoR [Chryseobacterium sp. MOF25P]|uniref:ATP-binding protein n=1 Tax=unclassified Chryseobacterium TaxID=2593645 RepID=UPI0008047E47|nr:MULTISPECIES: ATP-binding protein [unclassified Chryseobacterium]OBW40670.1 Alkaline phosphatase synthesis sensor protein PhoR [Chryseobacterium sp. MOF25P]OBW46533.1 Alkaline phosphatase synthesis sensor protein PhoR [Chryseobacterium sp. BGARF1]
MSSFALFIVVLIYLALLFLVAHLAEKKKSKLWINNPYIYALSLAVYCTAWTYYGSIGVAATSGLNYLPIYIGPIMVIPAWIYINTRIVRISRVNKISSLADFISLRYGNSRSFSAIITLVCLFAIIPYIGLQIKAISETFHLVTETSVSKNIFTDSGTFVVVLIAVFSSYYGTKYVDASEKRLGIISAIALESFLKLFFIIILGLFVIYYAFDGFSDLYQKASKFSDFKAKNTFNGIEGAMNWMVLCLISGTAICILPRQFHTAIVENRQEKHIKTAIWFFPLYLLIFTIFIFPIAWGGRLIFQGQNVNPEFYSILIPQHFDNTLITVLVFLGGLSSCISMIIISAITLSIMLSNNLIIPYGLLGKFKAENETQNTRNITNVRKFSIFGLIIVAFAFYKYFILKTSLDSVGLISFVIIAQLAPAFFGAIFWRRGSYKGAIIGLFAGLIICYFGLIVPQYYFSYNSEIKGVLRDMYDVFDFFSIPYLGRIPEIFFWSILVNTGLFTILSVSMKGNYRERNFAELYVDIDKYIQNHENAFIWRGTAYVSDIKNILERFLGKKKTEQAMRIFNIKYNIDSQTETADSRFIKFSENLLAGRIGTASAKILIEGVTKEDKISLKEVLNILEESKENITLNKKLTEKSEELKQLSNDLSAANENLIVKDRQKDDFLDSVAHELRTPITAIRSAGEILADDDDIPLDIKREFLNNIITESDRLSEIINDILYLDKLQHGEIALHIQENNIVETYKKALNPILHLIQQKYIHVSEVDLLKNYLFKYDEARFIQLFQNILGNALKFTDEQGTIQTKFSEKDNDLIIKIFNTGKNIPEEDLEMIFDKFYQSKNQNIIKPTGSGLGLAISKRIVEAHNGTIKAENSGLGVTFTVTLTRKNIKNNEVEP